ncbi:MAG: hypothetical protein AVDCRST_MAG74-1272 [uncultured Pyrinomonadaceae bacterium]|uniref:Uncharacterized protein n=1 Tax=uncultured Pyrinomonadaceae bacterium TaxID=2283094 RepID=A0A6J4NQ03_9BACT|nr:MAG: hypothetical protein AVDCRST_MAG74-1272 [uncultured Pyrinomonadaceae bacterium]
MEFFERLDRAGGDRSAVGAEVENRRSPAQIAQAKRSAADLRQLEIGSRLPGFNAARFNGSSTVFDKNFSFEMLVIVFFKTFVFVSI